LGYGKTFYQVVMGQEVTDQEAMGREVVDQEVMEE
jgi:hypothetical protein